MKKAHALLHVFDLTVYLLAFLLLYLFAPSVNALTMKNNSYIIQMGNLNTGAGKGANSQYGLSVTIGQTAPGLYTGTNYKVRSGFQYIYSIIPFSFSITPLEINFGTLSPTNFVTRTQTVTVKNGSAFGYVVTAAENHQLLVPAIGAMIPNTSCDSGTCTTSLATAWTNTFAFGFGLRCEYFVGSTCTSDFNGANLFRPLADKSAGQTPQAFISASNVTHGTTETFTYKINVSASQAAGDYSNVVELIATPTF
ncbi:MAG: hypothetical protein KGJ07_04995 [Patescibacteria group bacterium]|nr:hypothetical protein [Patescibacteria group bacterium]MDE2591170.1 hypothetical protein [Patescibacteria group bacterium]